MSYVYQHISNYFKLHNFRKRTQNPFQETLSEVAALASTYFNLFRFIKRGSIVYMILLFIPLIGTSQSRLDELKETALKNNVALKAQYNYYLAAVEKISQAKALPDLKVNFGVFISPVETRVGAQRANMSVSQMFPWFGTLKAKEQAKVEIVKAQYQSFENTKYEILYQVNSSYNNLYIHDKTKIMTKENLKLLSSFKELARVKFEAGKGSFADVLKVEMEMSELENELNLLQLDELPLNSKLEALLNSKLNSPIAFPDSLDVEIILMDKSVIRDSIFAQNHLLKKLDYKVSSLKKEEAVAQKSGMPSFTLGLNYINIQKRSDVDIINNGRDALLPQVGFNIPLHRKKNKAFIKEKVLLQEAVGFEKENISNRLITDFEEKYNNYQTAVSNIKLNKKLHGLARQSLNILVAEYSAAGSAFEEIIKMNRQVLKYALAIENAKAQQNTAVAYINYLMAKN